MIQKESLITWHDSREEMPKDGEGIFACVVLTEGKKGVIKASGKYQAKDNILHIVKFSKYPWFMWCSLNDISPWKK